MRSSIIVVSAGRPELLQTTLDYLVTSFSKSAEIVLIVPDPKSLPANISPSVNQSIGPRGCSAQRNAGMMASSTESEFYVFFDDDTVPAENYVAEVENYFDQNPQVLALTGLVLRDGGIDFDEARKFLAERQDNDFSAETNSLYGCNLAVRASIGKTLRFDERLPLYSWLEDLDFARRCLRLGKISKVFSAQCVHLQHQSGGRSNHKRLGYSQIANVAHLYNKRSINIRDIFYLAGKPFAANVAGSLNRNPDKKWRRERLVGNLTGIADVMRGKITPERATDF